jgi:LacI family transcriptional regulator
VADENRNVTTQSIAEKLGVSRATVSIVLNGRAKQRKIRPETTRKVLEAAREMHYVPNQTALNLRRQRSGIVGVLLANFRMDWAERVMSGLLEVFDPRGYCPFVAAHRFEVERYRRELTAALQRRDEGVICHPLPGHEDLYREFARVGMPLVFIGDVPVELPGSSYVVWDSGAAARAAVRHLVEMGRKRIGYIGFEYPLKMSLARFEAYQEVLRETDLLLNRQWMISPPAQMKTSAILDLALKRMFAPGRAHPDAIFVLNDGLALPALEALAQRGIRVPDDVAVMGMGDLPLTGHQGISLSTVREPCEEMGHEAAETILKLIAHPKRAPIQRALTLCELKVRRTTVG